MKYRVIKFFTDIQDNNHKYNVGDDFPRIGKDVTPSRLVELSTSSNRRGVPVIEGYEPDGETIEPKKRGRKKAVDNE